MSSVVDLVGRLVSAQVPAHGRRARRLLTTAYETVVLKGRLARPGTVDSLVDRFNGRIARRIIDGLLHPERSVIVNIFMPCEIFEAFGLTPLFPEGVAVYVACTAASGAFGAEAEARGIPESFCSYHKVMLGMVESGVIGKPLLVAATTLACDANQVSFRRVAADTEAPEFLIDVPRAIDDDAIDYVYGQLIDLTATLEVLTGRSLDMERLRARVALSKETLALARAYGAKRALISLPTTMTSELCTLIATHCLLGTDDARRYCRELLDLAERGAARDAQQGRATSVLSGKLRVPRIYWMHTLPNWSMSLRGVFDGAREVELVGSDIADDYPGTLDDEDPLRFLARRIVENANNGPGVRRVNLALEEALGRGADGVVVFCHSGCKQTLGLATLARESFEAAGLPTLLLDGDGCDGRHISEEAVLTRAAAFAELLRKRL